MCRCMHHVCGLPTAGASRKSSQAPNSLGAAALAAFSRGPCSRHMACSGGQLLAPVQDCQAPCSHPATPRHVQTCPNSQACTDAPVYWTWPSNWLECTRRQRAASTASSETCFKALRVPGARLNAGHAALVELRVDDRQQAAQQRVILRHAHHLLPAHLSHLRGPPRVSVGSAPHVRPGCCRCITPVTLLSVVECKHVAAPHAGRCPLRGWPAAKRPIFCRKSAGEGRVQNSGHAGRRIEPGQAPLAAARRRRYRPRRSHVLRLEHVQVFFDANPASMMPGSVSPSPLPGPHAAADANASLRMHEVW